MCYSFEECSRGAPNEILPIHVSCALLELADTDSMKLAQLLGVEELSTVDLLTQVRHTHSDSSISEIEEKTITSIEILLLSYGSFLYR